MHNFEPSGSLQYIHKSLDLIKGGGEWHMPLTDNCLVLMLFNQFLLLLYYIQVAQKSVGWTTQHTSCNSRM